MATFTLSVDQERQLTTVVVHGSVTREELLEHVRVYYGGETTDLVLWDVRDADLSAIHAADVRAVVAETVKFAQLRGKGRTAILVGDALGFGLGRMFDTYQELDASPRSHRTFKTLEEAYRWLFQDP